MARRLKSVIVIVSLGMSLLAHAAERPLKPLAEEPLQQLRGSANPVLRHLADDKTTLSISLVQVQGELIAATSRDLQLDLEAGVSRVFHKARISTQPDGIVTWQGTVSARQGPTDDQNTAYLTRHGAHLVGVVKVDGQLYRIEPLGDGRHAVVKVDASKFPEGNDEVNEEPAGMPATTPAAPAKPAAHAAPVVIRVLTLVSNKAFELMPDMDASVANALAMANSGLENSQINVQFENAGVQRIDWTESGTATGKEVLSRLWNVNDAQLGQPARYQRDASRADLLSLLTVIPDVCGLAYTALNKNAGVSIVDPKCLSNHTFAHELGHQAREEIGAEALTVVADRGYYKGPEILACEQTGITTFVPKPLTSSSKAEGRFGKQDFIYIAASNEYRCPAGQLLTRRHSSVEDGMLLHCYWFSGCQSCSMQQQCTTGKERRLKRWEHEAVVERVQIRLEQDPGKMKVRRQKVEHPFGTLKFWMGSTHFLTKTLPRVSTEMSLHVLAYNLKRMMSIFGIVGLLEAIRA